MATSNFDQSVFEHMFNFVLNQASPKAIKKIEKIIASQKSHRFPGTRIILGAPLFRKQLFERMRQSSLNAIGLARLFLKVDMTTGETRSLTLDPELSVLWDVEGAGDAQNWLDACLEYYNASKAHAFEIFHAYWFYRALYRDVGEEPEGGYEECELVRQRFFLVSAFCSYLYYVEFTDDVKPIVDCVPELTKAGGEYLDKVLRIGSSDRLSLFYSLAFEWPEISSVQEGFIYASGAKLANDYLGKLEASQSHPELMVLAEPQTWELYKKRVFHWGHRVCQEGEFEGCTFFQFMLIETQEEFELFLAKCGFEEQERVDIVERAQKGLEAWREKKETRGQAKPTVAEHQEALSDTLDADTSKCTEALSSVTEEVKADMEGEREALVASVDATRPEVDESAQTLPEVPVATITKLEARAQYVFEDESSRTLEFPSKEKIAKRPHPVSPHYRRFLGRLVQLGTFYNLLIHAEEVGGVFVPVNMDEIRTLYPKHGAFNVRSSARKKFIDGGYYVIDLERDDLEHNINSTTNSRREDYEFMVNYERLNRDKRFYQASDFGLYMVVYPEDPQCALDQTIFVCLGDDNKTFLHQGVDFQVLLKVGDKYLGPVPLRRNAQNRPYVNFPTGTSNGVISAFVSKPDQRASTIYWEEWSMAVDKAHYETVEIVDIHSLTPIYYDVMTDEWLLRKLVSQVTTERGSRDALYAWAKDHHEADDLFSGDKAVREARYARLLSILRRDQENERFYTDVARLVSSALLRLDEESDLFDAIVKQVAENPQYKERLESHQLIASELSQQRRRLEDARLAAEEVERTTKEKRESLEGELKTRHKRLTNEVERLQTQVEQQRQTLAHIEEGASIEAYVDELRHHVTTMSEQKKLFEEELAGIGEKLKESVKEYRKYAFDGMLANQFLEAASQWTQNDEEERRQARQALIHAVTPSDLSGQALIQHVLKSVKAVRRYQSNDILNIFIALTQNFLTVFSGPPGLGKTSMCNLVGQVLGLNLVGSPDGEASRYLSISVERGWTGKRDLIGYWNPLTKSFESVDLRRYEAFRQLDSEAREKKTHLPFVMLLDEANLSPMEYYWADFMNLCDEHGPESQLSLGDKRTCMIPETLRFVATINNDHTTETLSPRLIDRAMVVTLPELGWRGLISDEREVTDVSPDFVVSWQALKEVFGPKPITRDRADIEESLEAVFNQMAKGGFHLSQRVHRATQHYISAAMSLFEKGNYPSSTVVAIDYAVAQKVLPHIEGHGPSFEAWLRELEGVLGQYGLEKSKKEVERILLTGEAKMKYFRFFS